MADKHIIGLMPGTPAPRIVGVCDDNGEAWYEVHVRIKHWYPHHDKPIYRINYISHWERGDLTYYNVTEQYPDRYDTRSEALAACREYIYRENARARHVLSEEVIDSVEASDA